MIDKDNLYICCHVHYLPECGSVFLQLALGFLLFPGRILGSEIRPRKYKYASSQLNLVESWLDDGLVQYMFTQANTPRADSCTGLQPGPDHCTV